MSAKPVETIGGDLTWCEIPTGTIEVKHTIRTGQHSTEVVTEQVEVADFTVSSHAITNAQFQKFLEAEDGYRNIQWWSYSRAAVYDRKTKPQPPASDNPNAVRGNVDWRTALAFSRWLTNQTGELYRLPTSSEWVLLAQHLDKIVVDYQEWVVNIEDTGADIHPYGKCSSEIRGKAPRNDSILAEYTASSPQSWDARVGFRLVRTGEAYHYPPIEVDVKAAIARAESGDSEAFKELAISADPEAVQALIQMIEVPNLQYHAFKALRVLSEWVAIPAQLMIDALGDKKKADEALTILNNSGEAAIEPLRKAVFESDNPNIRRRVLSVLCNLTADSFDLPLAVLQNETDPGVRQTAVILLGKNDREEAHKVLIQYMLDEAEDMGLRQQAAQALLNQLPPASREAFEQLKDHSAFMLAEVARQALEKLG